MDQNSAQKIVQASTATDITLPEVVGKVNQLIGRQLSAVEVGVLELLMVGNMAINAIKQEKEILKTIPGIQTKM